MMEDLGNLAGLNLAQVMFPGMMVEYPIAGTTAPSGWVWADGSAYDGANVLYAPLYAVYGTTHGNGSGLANSFNVPDRRGRTVIGAGTGISIETLLSAGSPVNTETGVITVGSNSDKLITGMPIVYTTSGTVITGLTSGLTYYVIRMTSTTIKLASSLASAQAGTGLTLSSQGTGTHLLTYNLTARTVGQRGGEEAHAMSITELLAHSHQVGTPSIVTAGPNATGVSNGGTFANTASTGGNAGMNIVQPYDVTKWIIKL